MFSFAKIRELITRYIQPSLYMRGVENFLRHWRVSDVKDRGILLLIFAPMYLCLGGLILNIVYFVLFVLPSYLFTFIGLIFLAVLFGEGANYFFNHFKGNSTVQSNNSEYIDVQFTENKSQNVK